IGVASSIRTLGRCVGGRRLLRLGADGNSLSTGSPILWSIGRLVLDATPCRGTVRSDDRRFRLTAFPRLRDGLARRLRLCLFHSKRHPLEIGEKGISQLLPCAPV